MTGYAEELFSDHGVDVYGTLNEGLIEMGRISVRFVGPPSVANTWGTSVIVIVVGFFKGVRFAFGRLLIQALARVGCIARREFFQFLRCTLRENSD